MIFSRKIQLNREEGSVSAAIGYARGTLAELQSYIGDLHELEHERLMSFKHDVRKSSYLAGRVAAKQAISQLTAQALDSIFISKGIFEFPVVRYIQNTNMQVSITHCNGVAMAIAFDEEHPIGIDLEMVHAENLEALAEQILPNERKLMDEISLDNDVGVHLLWSMKEALSKILRTGLMIDFGQLEFEKVSVESGKIVANYRHYKQYKAIGYIKDDYVLGLAMPRNTILSDQLHLLDVLV